MDRIDPSELVERMFFPLPGKKRVYAYALRSGIVVSLDEERGPFCWKIMGYNSAVLADGDLGRRKFEQRDEVGRRIALDAELIRKPADLDQEDVDVFLQTVEAWAY